MLLEETPRSRIACMSLAFRPNPPASPMAAPTMLLAWLVEHFRTAKISPKWVCVSLRYPFQVGLQGCHHHFGPYLEEVPRFHGFPRHAFATMINCGSQLEDEAGLSPFRLKNIPCLSITTGHLPTTRFAASLSPEPVARPTVLTIESAILLCMLTPGAPASIKPASAMNPRWDCAKATWLENPLPAHVFQNKNPFLLTL